MIPTQTSFFKKIQYSAGLVMCALLCAQNISVANASTVAGRIIFTVGDVYLLTPEGQRKTTISHGSDIVVSDTLATGPDGYAHLRMSDNAFIALRPDSVLRIDEYNFSAGKKALDRVKISLLKGKLRSISGQVAKRSKDRYRLNTPVAAIGVRGTDYTVVTTAQQSQVDVLQGGIAMSPFNSQCKAAALGPCRGSSVVDLYAGMNQHYLQLNASDQVPNLIEGRLNNLSPPEDDDSLLTIKPAQATSSGKTAKTPSEQATEPAATTSETANSGEAVDTSASAAAETEQDKAASADDSSNSTETEAGSPAAGTKDELTAPEGETSDNIPSAEAGDDENVRAQIDSDGDGVTDLFDDLPDDPTEQLDTDQDGIGNKQDLDDDNDGLSDVQEHQTGSNPLSGDTDNDGVSDKQDSRPLSNAGVTLKKQQQDVTLSEAEFAGLIIKKVQLNQLSSSNTTGEVMQQTLQLTDTGTPYLTLSRKMDTRGRAFWGEANTARAWDYKLNTAPDSITLPPQNGADNSALNDAWAAYYRKGNFTPLVENNTQYLSSVDGLVATTTPNLNQTFPKLGLIYELSASDINLIDSQGTAQQASVIDFDFKMNYTNQTFEAVLLTRDSQGAEVAIQFQGAVSKSGMVFGGSSDAYLKGFFVNQMSQIALIFEAEDNSQQYSGTLIIDRNFSQAWAQKLEKTFARYQTADKPPVSWGRWSNFSEITSADDYANLAKGNELIDHNRVFALMRTADQDISLPTEGVFSFELNTAEAVYKQGEFTETALVSNPTLSINFNNRSFETALRVSAPSIAQGISVNAAGVLQDDGLFFSNPDLSNSSISGAVHNNGTGASMIFERDLEQDAYISGAVDWTR